jgi:pyruvate formate lyase activating enzyme
MQIDFLLELFTLFHSRGIHTCLDSSGIAYRPDGNPEWLAKLDKLCEVTDLVMLDIKHIDPKKHMELVKQPNDGILAFAEYLDAKNVEVWIRHVVVPGITDDPEDLHRLGYFIGGSMSSPTIRWERKSMTSSAWNTVWKACPRWTKARYPN